MFNIQNVNSYLRLKRNHLAGGELHVCDANNLC